MSGHAAVNEDGTFTVENLEPGTYTIVAVAIQGAPETELDALMNARFVTRTIEITPDTPLEITLKL
jgi:hypothetical protein